jgi:hypothetical protein
MPEEPQPHGATDSSPEAHMVAVPLPANDISEAAAACQVQRKGDEAATEASAGDESSNLKYKDHTPHAPPPVIAHANKSGVTAHHANHKSDVPVAGEVLARAATLGTRWHRVNWACVSLMERCHA